MEEHGGELVLTLKDQLGNDQLGARKMEHGGERFTSHCRLRDTRERLVRGTQDGGAWRGELLLTLKGQLGNDQFGARKMEHGGKSFTSHCREGG